MANIVSGAITQAGTGALIGGALGAVTGRGFMAGAGVGATAGAIVGGAAGAFTPVNTSAGADSASNAGPGMGSAAELSASQPVAGSGFNYGGEMIGAATPAAAASTAAPVGSGFSRVLNTVIGSGGVGPIVQGIGAGLSRSGGSDENQRRTDNYKIDYKPIGRIFSRDDQGRLQVRRPSSGELIGGTS